jgi:hypothetical protein
MDKAMEFDRFSEARENSKAVLDRMVAEGDVTLISRRHAQTLW